MHRLVPGHLHGIGGFANLGFRQRQLLLITLLTPEGDLESCLGTLQLGPARTHLLLECVPPELEAIFLSGELVMILL